jgi:hypothetical protein
MQGQIALLSAEGTGREGIVVMASATAVDLPAEGLLMDASSEVASKRSPVLHIRLHLPEN